MKKNGEKYFDIINDYLNSISTNHAKIIINHDSSCNKFIKVYDNYYNDDVVKKSFFGKHETYHRIEWKNYGITDDESSNNTAFIEFTDHYCTEEGAGKVEKSTVCVMPFKCAKALFTHAERIACLISTIKK